jgi:YHS domain-containing protein
MPNLRRLELRGTVVTDAGVASLAKHPRLEEIILAQTHLTDAAVEHLLSLPSLKAVFLWNAGLSPEAIARLRSGREGLHIDTGEVADAEALETETEVKLSGGTPPPRAPAPGEAPATAAAGGGDALKPINTVCPVSGTAVNPEYRIVYKGRVIGFCCQHCPVQFWADPAKYEAKLP